MRSGSGIQGRFSTSEEFGVKYTLLFIDHIPLDRISIPL